MKKKNIPVIRKDDKSFLSSINPSSLEYSKSENNNSDDYDFLKNENYPEAIWNLGGAFRHDELLCLILKQINGHLNKLVNLSEVNGSLPCLWSLEWYQDPIPLSPQKIIEILEKYAVQNLGVILNLNNPLINETHLNDIMGTLLLTHLFQHDRCRKNGVSVASSQLGAHINSKFPKLALHAHVNLIIAEEGQGNADYYNKLAEKYQRVAVHPDDAINAEFMSRLENKDRFEITLNDTCLQGCPCRKEHMETLGRIRMEPWNLALPAYRHDLLNKVNCEEVSLPEKNSRRPLLLTNNEIKTLYDMGYRRFRIQNESLRNEVSLAWQIIHALFTNRPELQNKVALAASACMILRKKTYTDPPSGLTDFNFSSYL